MCFELHLLWFLIEKNQNKLKAKSKFKVILIYTMGEKKIIK